MLFGFQLHPICLFVLFVCANIFDVLCSGFMFRCWLGGLVCEVCWGERGSGVEGWQVKCVGGKGSEGQGAVL